MLYRTRLLAEVRTQAELLRARSIKPFGGGRWRLRRMREAEGILIMGFLSCTEPLMNGERNISMPQLDHVVSRPEHST